MQTVSTFLDELARAAGSTERMREVIAAALKDEPGVVPDVTPALLSMWKQRGIPWRHHGPMRRVCAQLALPADPHVWRTTKQAPERTSGQRRKSGTTEVAA